MLAPIQTNIPLLEQLLTPWQESIGDDYLGYRNHVYSMVHFCWSLNECSVEEQQKIMIAGAFHDIGIWIENTVDYIEPSLPPAYDYLAMNNLSDWQDEIRLMITEHHKLTSFKEGNLPLVEIFRQGDLVDFSLGMVKFGLPKEYIHALKQAFPNAHFHKSLIKRASKWFIRHPLNPLPMMKW